MILAVDGGIATCGWAIVEPSTAAIVELGVVCSPHDSDVDETTDRARRLAIQSATFRELATRHHITTIAAEAVSLGANPKARLKMGMCQSLCWGSLVMLALELGASLLEIRPKQWQGAIQDGAKKIDYDKLFADLVTHIQSMPGNADVSEQLESIPKSQRNHAIDGSGIGIFAALRPHLATAIIARLEAAPS